MPDDPALQARMRDAHRRACRHLTLTADAEPEHWGHGGRTLSGPVTAGDQPAWLRVVSAPTEKAGNKLWTGTQQAAAALPADIPRPRLLTTQDWTSDGYAYRAELSDRVTTLVASPTPDLASALDLPDAWWIALRTAVEAVAAVPLPPERGTVLTQAYIHRTIPAYLGATRIDTTVRHWNTAHGDLHWANLTRHPLTILDWEGWAAAPAGYDAANLHAYTLAQPETAERVYQHFADILDTDHGRLAQLTAAASILQASERDPTHARLAPHVQTHAQRLTATSRAR